MVVEPCPPDRVKRHEYEHSHANTHGDETGSPDWHRIRGPRHGVAYGGLGRRCIVELN
ncbi:hypothetical protein RGR602_CH01955 [Rhizobium gallicum bv. gallicum R602sp]|uniref:Uncharacterized protein n=1 Tax=Rhizobium gallicum bv. gallicum R602sp TaxID=1041138 RepID=A0A0B4X3I0_9HYPH|nr:hypothetical protein RGR602_CH01955 [Rhizobium gallicum bv. gallicum R602sp]